MKSQLEIDKMKKQLNKYRNLIKKAQLSRDNRWRLRYLVDKRGGGNSTLLLSAAFLLCRIFSGLRLLRLFLR